MDPWDIRLARVANYFVLQVKYLSLLTDRNQTYINLGQQEWVTEGSVE